MANPSAVKNINYITLLVYSLSTFSHYFLFLENIILTLSKMVGITVYIAYVVTIITRIDVLFYSYASVTIQELPPNWRKKSRNPGSHYVRSSYENLFRFRKCSN